MKKSFIEIGFVILCCAVFIGIVGIFGYQLLLTKEKVEVSPVTEINFTNSTK